MVDTLLLRMTSHPETTLALRSRRRVAEVVDERLGARAPDLQLITSELVANAVEHAHGRVEVRLRRCGRALRIEVDDDDAGWPVLRKPDLREESGRGLVIVDALSDRWGVERSAGEGKTMWAEITCP